MCSLNHGDNPNKDDLERGQVDFFDNLRNCLHMEVGNEVREIMYTADGPWKFDYFRLIFDDLTYSTCEGVHNPTQGQPVFLNCNYCYGCG